SFAAPTSPLVENCPFGLSRRRPRSPQKCSAGTPHGQKAKSPRPHARHACTMQARFGCPRKNPPRRPPFPAGGAPSARFFYTSSLRTPRFFPTVPVMREDHGTGGKPIINHN